MQGGVISGNTASNYGGGVYVNKDGSFIKSGNSTIDATNSAREGKVVYVGSSPYKVRDSSAGPGLNLDSSKSGSADGWN